MDTPRVHPSAERVSVHDRNQEVLELIAANKIPILPFEKAELEKKLSGYVEDQTALGKMLGEAMRESSETWHDNAPADALNSASVNLSQQARGLLDTLRRVHVYDYPHEAYRKVTVGSLVYVSFDPDEPLEPVYLVGTSREVGDSEILDLPEGVHVVTPNSPIGSALFGMLPHTDVVYTVNGRDILIGVGQVLQLQPTISS